MRKCSVVIKNMENLETFTNTLIYKFLLQHNRFCLKVGGTLIILEAKVSDSGKYLCMVNNSVGGESVETVLTVTGQNYKLFTEREKGQSAVYNFVFTFLIGLLNNFGDFCEI